MKTMKKIIFTMLMVMMAATSSFAANKIGLSVGLDYMSDYQWRGTSFYGSNGALFPFLSYDIAGTGLVVSYIGEYGANFGEADYTSTPAYVNQGADFGLAYTIKIPKIMSIDLSATYLWYYLSGNSAGYIGSDASFLSLTAKFTFDVLLSPFVGYSHDLIFGKNAFIEFYIQAGISHDFKVAEGVSVGLGLTVGLYNSDLYKDASSLMMDIIGSAVLNVEVKGVALYGGIDLVVKPLGEFGTRANYFTPYAKFGASYSL